MSTTYVQLSSCRPSADDNAYIYQIAPLAEGRLAAITSADEVLVVDKSQLGLTPVSRCKGVPDGLTTLSADDQGRSLYCGDRHGHVSQFDVRAGGKTGAIDIGRGVTALRCRGHDLAVGTEVKQQQAVINVCGGHNSCMICFAITRCATQLDAVMMQVVNTGLIIGRDRDLRKNGMRWQNAENNDDITAIDFHPSKENLLLVGGDDGLVSIFDVDVAEEDDSLVQGVTHGPIHKAGFLHADALFALSSDQNLALHPVYSPERDQEPAPVMLGDLRPIVPCEYVIDIIRTGGGFGVATGSHSKSRIDIVGIQDGKLDLAKPVALVGAHGEEIVRSLFVDDQTQLIFTAGEDGCIKVFGPATTRRD